MLLSSLCLLITLPQIGKLRPAEMSEFSAIAVINMTEPGSPPYQVPTQALYNVVPEKPEQLIRKTWETTKRDETDKLGLDVQPYNCNQL